MSFPILLAASFAYVAPPPLTARTRHVTPLLKEEEVDPGAIPGTSLRVLKYPHPKLRAPNQEVDEFGYSLKQLTKEMFKVMYASRGVGLAAMRADQAAAEAPAPPKRARRPAMISSASAMIRSTSSFTVGTSWISAWMVPAVQIPASTSPV